MVFKYLMYSTYSKRTQRIQRILPLNTYSKNLYIFFRILIKYVAYVLYVYGMLRMLQPCITHTKFALAIPIYNENPNNAET